MAHSTRRSASNVGRLACGCCQAMVIIMVLSSVAAAVSAGEEVINYTAYFTSGSTTFPEKQLSVWVPQDVPLRGMLWVLPGRGGDSRYNLSDPSWQEPARALGLGLIGLDNNDGVQYAGSNLGEFVANFNAALNGAAGAANRPEIRNAPVAFYGFSWGGWNSTRYASALPNRVVCYVNDKYCISSSPLLGA